MSGSGGGSFGGQFGQDDFEVTCEKLTIDTQLSSPDPHVVAQLSIGVIMGIMQIKWDSANGCYAQRYAGWGYRFSLHPAPP